MAHHGELLQGVFEGSDGRLHRGLVTLPFPLLRSRAEFIMDSAAHAIVVEPADRAKATRAAALTLAHLGWQGTGGRLVLYSTIPPGFGYGSSTADVTAAILATARAVDASLRPSAVAALGVMAETASDSIAFGMQAVLFAHREGRVIEHLGGEFPPLFVIGFNAAPESPVDTLTFAPARYESWEIETFRTLRGLITRAVRSSDPRLLGRVATASARLNQRFLMKPALDKLIGIAQSIGACGVQVSHSGTVMGLLLDPSDRKIALQIEHAHAALRQIGVFDAYGFEIAEAQHATAMWQDRAS